MDLKIGQIRLLTKSNKLFEDITGSLKKIDIKFYSETVENIQLVFNSRQTLEEIMEVVCNYQIPLKIEITIEGKKDFFYLTPKYCWVDKKTGLEIIERGIAPCQVILLRQKNSTLIINKRVQKTKGQSMKIKLGYFEALNVIKEVIGEDEIKKYLTKDIQYRLNENLTYAAGQCIRYNNNSAIIELSNLILKYSEKVLISIFIHEILHAFTNTKGHDKVWKRYAKLINDNTIYRVTTCSDPDAIEEGFKYKICCNNCHGYIRVKTLSKENIKEIKSGQFKCVLCGSNDIKCVDTETNTSWGPCKA